MKATMDPIEKEILGIKAKLNWDHLSEHERWQLEVRLAELKAKKDK